MFFQKYKLLIFSSFMLASNIGSKLHAETAQPAVSDSIQTHYLAPTHIAITDSVINYGKMFLDTPYRFGSPGTDSFDCSGFTSYVYRNFGYNLQHSSADQAKQFDSIDRSQLKTGDLVYFSGSRRSKHVGHVGIVVAAKEDGNFDFIHASVQKGVTISSSTEPYYSKRFIKANRVIGGNPLLAVVPGLSPNKSNNIQTDNTFPVNTPIKQSTKTTLAEYHRVKRGETLASVAEKYGLTIAELKSKNGIKGNKIKPKQNLKVKDEETYTVVEPIQVAENKTQEAVPTTTSQKTETPVVTASHTVKKGESLFSIAKQYNISVDDLKKINNITSGSIRAGQELQLSQALAASEKQATSKPESTPVKTKMHKIISGESLFSIAKMYNMSVDDLRKINNLSNGNIHAGQELLVSQSAEIASNATVETKPVVNQKAITHKVKTGESLFLIAKNYNVSVDDLKKANNIPDGKIKPGQEIRISPSAEITANTPESTKPTTNQKAVTHKVKTGESLFLIAKNYNVSVDDLKKANNISDGKIKPGQEIKISQVTEIAANTAEPTKSTTNQKAVTHKVKTGESLFLIAKNYNVSVDDLKKANNIPDGKIKPGQEIKICGANELVEKPTEVAKVDASIKTIKHKVTKGESLFSIAKDNNITVDELKKINNLSSNEIKFGQEITLNQNSEPINTPNVKAETKTKAKSIHHKIKAGESFYSIAEKYGCTINDLKEWNRKLTSKLKIGDMLVILQKK